MVSGASWRAYLCKNPGAWLRDFISLKSGKLNTRLSEIRHFWENFVPNEWQSARTPFILLEPKEEPEDCSSGLGHARYRYCSAEYLRRFGL